ncbi:RNA polymerase sigma factor [Mucilaginibacter pocheonensis]|uniref:RNA polymerase sigma-70 factor (ECF subfamily) n=1 Tax=Mucilaginibacter pocheonensis TaxID=398050 RepID=A0ABU1T9L4_9SPHI|nr:sigma-70 family RNA polymerase sigma factor [Mucilaginibacter pocheonensis]MDR6941566.1 RNA polymerase sigma-70 factor (ECF subfamily) [Mucilaginibacter pocheonensis]
MKNLQSGDEIAFEKLYRHYVDPIFRKIQYLTKSAEIAEELTQDVFLKIWERRASIDHHKSFGAFVHRIAQNLITDLYRRLAHDRAFREELINSVAELYDPAASETDRQLVYHALNTLPAQRKKVMSMVKIEGMSYEEVSNLLGVSTSTIRDHVVKGTKSLKAYFAENELILVVVTASLIAMSTKT